MESSLVPFLRPGELLRFSMTRVRHGVEFAVEGEGDPGLEERVAAVLRNLRESGYRFAGQPVAPPVASPGRVPEAEWRSIEPLACQVETRGGGRLGFGGGIDPTGTRGRGTLLNLPRFLPCPGSGMPGRIFAGLAEAPGIRAVEVDFEAIELPEDPAQGLATVLGDLRTTGWGGAHGRPESPIAQEVLQRYLDLWLRHRTGYRLRFRARTDSDDSDVTLELAGRALYAAECRIVPASNPPEGGPRESSFPLAYPAGWSFPSLMPRPGARLSGGLAVLHNPRIPRLPRSGVRIGRVEGAPVRFPEDARACHTYVAGATGTGKSTLLLRLLAEDMRRGHGVVLLDPHGDLFRAALELVPSRRRGEVFLVDPARGALPEFNVLDIPGDAYHRRSVDLLADSLLNCFHDLWEGVDAFGPVFETYYLNTMYLLALQHEIPVTLADFPEVLTSESLRGRLLVHCEDESVRRFWNETATKARGEIALANVAPYISSKLFPLFQGEGLSRVLCGSRDEWQLARRIDEGAIVLVNLDKGAFGTRQSRVLGSLVMARLFGCGLSRSGLPPGRRKAVDIHIDEFQNFVSGSVAAMLSEARKFGLRLTLANQNLGQLEGRRRGGDLLDTVLGNAANQFFFRLGVADARRLADFTHPWAPGEMQFLPNHHALARILDGGEPLPPFVFETLPPPARRAGPVRGRAGSRRKENAKWV